MGERLAKEKEAALRAHRENLRSAIDSFKLAIERDTRRAPAGMKLDARTAMWDFSAIRTETEGEIRRMSGYFRTSLPPPSGFEVEFWRVCVALYLLDCTERMLEGSVKQNKPASVALFTTAKDAVKKILDDFYFFKPLERIVDDYMEGEVAISACAESCGVALLPFESVMKEYEETLRHKMNELNGF